MQKKWLYIFTSLLAVVIIILVVGSFVFSKNNWQNNGSNFANITNNNPDASSTEYLVMKDGLIVDLIKFPPITVDLAKDARADTSKWNRYTDIHGFTFMYPEKLHQFPNTQNKNEILFNDPAIISDANVIKYYGNIQSIPYYMAIEVFSTSTSLLDIVRNDINFIGGADKVVSFINSNNNIDKAVYLYQRGMGDGASHVYIANPRNNQIVKMDFGGDPLLESSSTYRGILDTFSFQNTDNSGLNTSTWKTYKNDKNGIQFKYPDNWEIEEGYKGSSLIVTLKNEQGLPQIEISNLAHGYEGMTAEEFKERIKFLKNNFTATIIGDQLIGNTIINTVEFKTTGN